MARTKIVCTIGPSCQEEEMLRQLMLSGMDVARLNFSHGSHEVHGQWVERLKKVAASLGHPLCILQDLSGPKVRIGTFEGGQVFLKPGQEFILTTDNVIGNENRVQVAFEGLVGLAQGATRALLADGLIELKVKEIRGREVVTEVSVGGWLSDRKGISFPGRSLPLDALTEKDLRDLKVGLDLDVDYVALSFVRSHMDVLKLRSLICDHGSRAKVVAKLERPEALEDLEAILDASDAVMVARGDLGIELEPEKVPLVQKRIIREAQRRDVFVITATQMLESMVHNPWPTRAEASDVANAVLDGTDAVMLSGETATGKYPVRAVEMMERIIRQTESDGLFKTSRQNERSIHRGSFAGAIAWAAAETAEITGAKAICAFTQSGATARLISKMHPQVAVIGLCPDEKVLRQLNLAWGVTPLKVDYVDNTDDMIQEVERAILEKNRDPLGAHVVLVAGLPLGKPGSTNLMKVHRIGEIGENREAAQELIAISPERFFLSGFALPHRKYRRFTCRIISRLFELPGPI